jgi:hypothetical protein
MTTICADLPVEQRHRNYIEARMNVWRKGYGVLCDVDGILYVYERID